MSYRLKPFMAPPAIQTQDIVKVYKRQLRQGARALDGISFSVREGEIFGLLGRNGAGKTTLLRILTTLMPPTSGSASVMGYDVQKEGVKVRQHICAVLQENALEMFLSVKDNLMTYARFHSVPSPERELRARNTMEQFGLAEHANKKVMDLSGGLKRRLQVAKIFMVDTLGLQCARCAMLFCSESVQDRFRCQPPDPVHVKDTRASCSHGVSC